MAGAEINTYSLVGRCARNITGELGALRRVGCPRRRSDLSRFPARGRRGQHPGRWVNPYLARDALDRMEAGAEAGAALAAVIAGDAASSFRQIGAIATIGPGAAFTGESCTDWHGQARWPRISPAQGNMLTGPETLDAMVDAFADLRVGGARGTVDARP